MPGHFVIRPARLQDALAIAEVQVASWRATYAGIVAQSYIDALSVPARTAAWERQLGPDGAVQVLVAEAAAAAGIVGFVSGGAIREPHPGCDAELYAIYLLPHAQRQGLGRRLVAAWSQHVVAAGFHAGIVRVLAANPSRTFYERVGARWIKDGDVQLAGQSYPETWYGWDNLGAIAS